MFKNVSFSSEHETENRVTLTETGLKRLDKSHDESGSFRDLFEHFRNLVMATANQTGFVDALNVVANLSDCEIMVN